MSLLIGMIGWSCFWFLLVVSIFFGMLVYEVCKTMLLTIIIFPLILWTKITKSNTLLDYVVTKAYPIVDE